MRLILTFLTVIAVMTTACSSDDTTRDEDGTITEGGEIDVLSVREGDCVDLPDGIDVTDVTGVACDEPHEGQIFALFDVDGYEIFPGDELLASDAESGCVGRFEEFIGVTYADSIYYINSIRPSADTWEREDDREVICVVVAAEGERALTKDLRGANE